MSTGSKSTTTQSTQLPPDLQAAYSGILSQEKGLAGSNYTGELAAGLTDAQKKAITQLGDASSTANPYFSQASDLLQQGSTPTTVPDYVAPSFNYTAPNLSYTPADLTYQPANLGYTPADLTYKPADVSYNPANLTFNQVTPYDPEFSAAAVEQYMSPYENDVVNSTMAVLNQQNQQQQSQLKGSTAAAGALGSDRAGVAQAALMGQQSLANNSTIANLYNQAYAQALGQYNTVVGQKQTQSGQQISANAQNLTYDQILQAQAGQQLNYDQVLQAQAAQGLSFDQLKQAQAGQQLSYDQLLQAQAGQGLTYDQLKQAQAGQQLDYGNQQIAAANLGLNYDQLLLGASGQQLTARGQQLSADQANKQAQLSAAGIYGNLGSADVANRLAANEALMNAGTVEQQTAQNADTAAYQKYLQQYTNLANLASILGSAANATGQTVSTTKKGSSIIKTGGRVPHRADGGFLPAPSIDALYARQPFGYPSSRTSMSVPNDSGSSASMMGNLMSGVKGIGGINESIKSLGEVGGIEGLGSDVWDAASNAGSWLADAGMAALSFIGLSDGGNARLAMGGTPFITRDLVQQPLRHPGHAATLGSSRPTAPVRVPGLRMPKMLADGGDADDDDDLSTLPVVTGQRISLADAAGGDRAARSNEVPESWNSFATHTAGAPDTLGAAAAQSIPEPESFWQRIGAAPQPGTGEGINYKPGSPGWGMPLLTAIASGLEHRSIGAGLGAGLSEYVRENELDAKPTIDNSGPTQRIFYPSEKKWVDTGLPTMTSVYHQGIIQNKQDTLALKAQQTQDAMAQRKAEFDAREADRKAQIEIARAAASSGRYALQPGMGTDSTGKQIPGAYAFNQKTGQVEFKPGIILTPKGSQDVSLSPESAARVAAQYIAGDPSAIQQVSFRDAAGRAMVQNEITKQAAEQHMSPQDIAELQSTFKNTTNAFAKGIQGNAVRSFNAAIAHLDLYKGLAAALQNNDVQAVNKIRNSFKQQFGYDAPTNVEAVKGIVGSEISKAINGSAGALEDRLEVRNSLVNAGSWDQMLGAINQYQGLMGGQLHALKLQYENGTHLKDFDSKLSPRSKEILSSLDRQGGGGDPSGGTNYQEGQTATGPGGKKLVFHGGKWVPQQ
jgi:hypothetical protein